MLQKIIYIHLLVFSYYFFIYTYRIICLKIILKALHKIKQLLIFFRQNDFILEKKAADRATVSRCL